MEMSVKTSSVHLKDGSYMAVILMTFSFKSRSRFRVGQFPHSAYLPDSAKGVKILDLVQKAFKM